MLDYLRKCQQVNVIHYCERRVLYQTVPGITDVHLAFFFFFFTDIEWDVSEREAPTKTNKQKTFSLCLYIYLYWMCKLILLQDLMANWSNRSMETGQWKRFIDCFILLWSSFWPWYLDDFVFGFSFTCTGSVLICRILYIHVQYRNAYLNAYFQTNVYAFRVVMWKL